MEGSQVVGRPAPAGVISEVSTPARSNGRSVAGGRGSPQALWLFSADACGLYGFPDVVFTHAGSTPPIGEVALTSSHNKLKFLRAPACSSAW
jgi:hypothetical protein